MTMKIEIQKGKKVYTLYGVESFTPSASSKRDVCLYMEKEGQSVYFIHNAKVISAYVSDLPFDVWEKAILDEIS